MRICDRCNKKHAGYPAANYDLCKECYLALIHWIQTPPQDDILAQIKKLVNEDEYEEVQMPKIKKILDQLEPVINKPKKGPCTNCNKEEGWVEEDKDSITHS